MTDKYIKVNLIVKSVNSSVKYHSFIMAVPYKSSLRCMGFHGHGRGEVICMWVRGQLAGVSSLLQPDRSQGLNTAHQAWLPAPLSAEPSHEPLLLFFGYKILVQGWDKVKSMVLLTGNMFRVCRHSCVYNCRLHGIPPAHSC